MPYVKVHNQKLFFTRQGHQGPALVLIHGAGGTHLHWPAELRRLPDASVYALDLPGHGRSKGPGRDSIEGYVEVLIAWLDALEIDQAILTGHSMGGAIAQISALTYPSRVAGLVLVGTGARLRVASAILEGIWEDFPATADLITRWAWAPNTPENVIDLGRRTTLETPPQVLYDDFAACDRFDIMERLAQINAPALVVVGTQDRLTPPKYGVYLQEHIPNARLLTIKGGGHMMAIEQPAPLAQAVQTFVSAL